MNFIKTSLNDVYLINPSVFLDNRGSFHESFNTKEMESIS